ncbi:hypothetical protein OL239_16365 [Arthrobacter sp. ATA002]|uniref:hypothetical protein n=1 Tax=Arthrobacter sp. ATA002 TaxID=2991715 RepID=UPI0022A77069|nr:hypothetical protein [Arthrobacter sp. ATA002]WAP51376.1 hypothetical protein OL239_16365 [Arthrobacter sp. ATA002]
MITFIKALPQPLKTLYILVFAVFAVGFVLTVAGNLSGTTADGLPVWFPVMGALMVLIGICLATDYKSSAVISARAAGNHRPMGMRNSRTLSPRPGSCG